MSEAAGRWDVLTTVNGQEQPVLIRRHTLRDLPEPYEAGLHRITVRAYKTDQLEPMVEWLK